MLTFESGTCSINEIHNGDALAVRPHILAAFDGVSSENANGEEAKTDFLEHIDNGKSVEEAIRDLIQKQRHITTIALATITSKNELKIYRIGDSRVRIHDEQGKLVYQTPDQNLFGEIKSTLDLPNAFYEQPTDKIFAEIMLYPELRERLIKTCSDFMLEKHEKNLFDPNTVKRVLVILNCLETFQECSREIETDQYSTTLLKMLFNQSTEFLNYCLADPESSAFIEPVKTLTPKTGYRVVVGTDGIFAHLRETMITDIINIKTVGFAIKALVHEAFRRSKRRADVSGALATLASA